MLVLIIAFFSKETMPIIGSFLFTSTFIYYYADKQKIRLSLYGFSLAFLCLIVQMLIISWAETKLGHPSKPNLVYRYLWSDNPINPSYYPTDILGKIKNIIKNAPYIWIFLWEPQITGVEYLGVKSELHFSVLATGGWAFFVIPVLLIGALPIYFYKLYSLDMHSWGTLPLQHGVCHLHSHFTDYLAFQGP